MKTHTKVIATGLIALLALSPLLSIAGTGKYRYQFAINATDVENSGSGGNEGEGGEGQPEEPKPGDDYETFYSKWENVGDIYACSEFSPLAETIPSGVRFDQTAKNCSQDQEREVITYKFEEGNEDPIIIGDPKIETQTLTGQETVQEAVGTKAEFSIYVMAPKIASANNTLYLDWNSNGATNYQLKASSSSAGFSTTYTDIGSRRSQSLTPTEPGIYTYSILGTNSSGQTTEAHAQVEVIDFEIKNFIVEETQVSQGGDVHLSWEAPEGATVRLGTVGDVTGKNSIVVKAPDRPGSHFWMLFAEKTINGELVATSATSNYYEIVKAPVIVATNSPKIDKVVADGLPISLGWTSSSAVRYTIQSNDPNSGVPTTPVEVSGSPNEVVVHAVYPAENLHSRQYVYTIKGYNTSGVAGELKITATMVPSPTLNYIKTDKLTASPGDSVTLSWDAIGVKTITIKDLRTNQIIYSGTGSGSEYSNRTSMTVPVGNTPGYASWSGMVQGLNSQVISTISEIVEVK
ncbi:MAG: hypothetical protein RSD49_04775 [Hafnia sp.]